MQGTLMKDRLYVTVDLMILRVGGGKLWLYLSRRPSPPYEGLWALPGRFVDIDMSAENAAEGLIGEMLPHRDVYLEQLYTFTDVNRDPRGRVISVGYLAVVPSFRSALSDPGTKLHPFEAGLRGSEIRLTGDDGTVLTGGDMAFDHGSIAAAGIGRLRGKIDYTDIAFRFLKDTECFSLGEMQEIYEAVLGRPLDKSNFRRSILGRYEKTGRIEQTDRTERAGRGRPSGLYRLKE